MPDEWDDSFRKRFWSKVDCSGGVDACWPWMAFCNPVPGQNYGLTRVPGRRTRGAHRVAYALAHAEGIPVGLYVCHHCDNPPCCNPRHLFVGTHQDNVDDKVSKGRQSRGERHSEIRKRVAARGGSHGSKTHPEMWRRGVDRPDAAFTASEVHGIRVMYSLGGITLQEIATRYGVSKSTISRLVRRKTYVDVPR